MQILKKNQTKNKENEFDINSEKETIKEKIVLSKNKELKKVELKEKKEINIQNNNQHKKEVWFAS
jgi:hypothetical protein